jgi:hypothetical protein
MRKNPPNPSRGLASALPKQTPAQRQMMTANQNELVVEGNCQNGCKEQSANQQRKS